MRPVLSVAHCIPVLAAAAHLQMEEALQEATAFFVGHLRELAAAHKDVRGLPRALLTHLAQAR
jgi:hypothetical protein